MKEAKDPRHSRPQGARHLHFKTQRNGEQKTLFCLCRQSREILHSRRRRPPPSGTRTEEAKEAHSIFVEDDTAVITDEEELENLYSAKEKN